MGPTYRQVCTGSSGHDEVLYVQGNDRGFQYSSWIFCGDDEQLQIAKRVKAELQGAIDAGAVNNKFVNAKVETQLCELKDFTKAEEEHQMYLFNNPNGYCNHRMRLKEWYKPE